jgi:hypothetical protein
MLLALACVAALVITWVIAIRTEAGQRADQKAIESRAVVDEETLDVARDVLDTISVAELAVAGGVLVFVGLFRRRLLLALSVGTVILGANVTTEVLKKVVIERPDLLDNFESFGNTFPSGHATVAMSLAVAAVLVVPRRFRGTAALAGVAYASAVSTAVLVTGWHRPSDALGAAFVAVGWGAGMSAVLVLARGDGADLPDRDAPFRPVMWILTITGALALVLVAVVSVTVLYRGSVGDLVVVDDGRAFVLAVTVILGTDLLGLGLLLVALRGVTLDPPSRRRAPAHEDDGAVEAAATGAHE